MGGDLNCVMTPLIDKLPKVVKSVSLQAEQMSDAGEELGLVDVCFTLQIKNLLSVLTCISITQELIASLHPK